MDDPYIGLPTKEQIELVNKWFDLVTGLNEMEPGVELSEMSITFRRSADETGDGNS